MSLGWACALLCYAGAAPAEPAATQARRFMMGTSIAVEAVGGDAPTRTAAIEEAYAAIAEVDRLMSNYRDDSELARVNKLAASEPVAVSDPMMAVLAAAQQVSRSSEGAFAVTVGPLVRLWGFHDKRPHVPTPQELARVRALVGYENLILDRASLTVRFARPGVEIDLGGIAKGFAVELAAGALKRRGLSGLIDAGGNQYLVGHPPGKTMWSVGIQHPDQKGKLLGVLEAPEGSVSTSGAYASFLVADGKRYGHILDPRTLQPAEAALSVTVLSPDATLADALSKIGFVLGPERGLRVVESFRGCSGVIAYRTPDGGVGVALSASLRNAFRATKPAGGKD